VEIEFGELEETQPEVHLRPDKNKHFVIASIFEPDSSDLPIYVDMDSLADMEDHALSDTGVELGGVMLGGQFEDENGRPFVFITDSLRAKHYESTKGSFKFTHDTWSEITRERDEFPDDLQIVGWYHTHPDWGVFLSGMDMFICDNFFNKTLDVALVIDPCRQDRGLFQWTGDEAERVRRTSGFFVTTSRFREDELAFFAAQLEGKFDMVQDPRFRGVSQQSAPIVNIAGGQPAWQSIAVLGMLALQFCLMMIVASRLLWPPETSTAELAQAAALQKSIEQLAATRTQDADTRAQLEVLDRFLHAQVGTPEGLVAELAEKTNEANDLKNALRGDRVLVNDLKSEIGNLTTKLASSDERAEYLNRRIKGLDSTIEGLKDDNKVLQGDLALANKGKDREETVTTDKFAGLSRWTWIAIGSAIAVLFVGAIAFSVANSKKEDDDFDETPDDPPEEANS
jgi:proteasome lid subunit RPN8/RPN11